MATTNISSYRIASDHDSEITKDISKVNSDYTKQSAAMINKNVDTSKVASGVSDSHANEIDPERSAFYGQVEADARAREAARSGGGGYSIVTVPGVDYSGYVPEKVDLSGNKITDTSKYKLDNIELDTSTIDAWRAGAEQQAKNQIDYAVQTGVNEYQRAYEDALPEYQTARNQVDIDEAKALDNQALYAEARGDRGGIGQAQYNAIMNTAMVQRRTINSQQIKLATDTARSIADLRAKGEFEKADALLTISQEYLGRLQELKQWTMQMNMDINIFNAEIEKWAVSFNEAIDEFMANYSLSYADLQLKAASMSTPDMSYVVGGGGGGGGNTQSNDFEIPVFKSNKTLVEDSLKESITSGVVNNRSQTREFLLDQKKAGNLSDSDYRALESKYNH